MITALVPVKKSSTRVPNKNFRAFAGSTLTDIKINQLLSIDGLRVMVNSDSQEVLDLLNVKFRDRIDYVLRPEYFGTSKCTAGEFFVNLAEGAKTKHVVYTPVTSPLITRSSIERGLAAYNLAIVWEDYDKAVNNPRFRVDSVASVQLMKDHMWLDRKPMNYEHGKVPNSQDLPDIMKITYGFCFISREKMINNGNVIGDRPEFIKLSEEEAWDIDTELDFELAEYMYKRNK